MSRRAESSGHGPAECEKGAHVFSLDEVALARRLLTHVPGEAVERAIRAASAAHRDSRRDEGTPYIRHPLRVALILVEELDLDHLAEQLNLTQEELVCAALLHDVVEDHVHPMGITEVREQFGERVAGLVTCLTDEFKGDALPRDERKAK